MLAQKPEYDWTPMEIGLILGMNSIGQVVACTSGVGINKIGGAVFLGIGKLGEAIISFTSPKVMDLNSYLFMAHRFALGLFEVIIVYAKRY